MLKIIFIRHAATPGNAEKRYIGRTDEPLSNAGIEDLLKHEYPNADLIFASPMKRCIQTAKLIYKDKEIITENDFRECDFGKFEGKNYIELTDDQDYQAWIDSNGTLPFPGGESNSDFKNRCINAFEKTIKSVSKENLTVAYVVHGGTIMSILEYFSEPKSSFYDWHVENGNGYLGILTDNKHLHMEGKLW